MKRFFITLAVLTVLTLLLIKVSPAAPAGQDLSISRVALYFENRKPETSVDKDAPDMKAYADVAYTGSGVLEGYWEVNGRVVSRVSQHLTGSGGSSVTLQTPKGSPLPTYSPGTQIVRLVITTPSTTLPPPSILYFVVPKEISCAVVDIKIVAPRDGAEAPYAPLKFSWEKVRQSTHFLIGFYTKPDTKPVFSAYTKETDYTIPDAVLKTVFRPGKKYFWKVMGFDNENNLICEHKVQGFTFKK